MSVIRQYIDGLVFPILLALSALFLNPEDATVILLFLLLLLYITLFKAPLGVDLRNLLLLGFILRTAFAVIDH